MVVYFSDMDRIERREFVRKHRTCVFGYNRQNDGPAMTVVYYVLDGDDLLVSTMAARAKAFAVQRSPKVSLCILDEQWPLTYLQVYGDATLEEDFGQAVDVLRRVIDLMAEKDVTSAKMPEIERMAPRGEPGRDPGPAVRHLRHPAAARVHGRGHRHADPLHQQQRAVVSVRPGPADDPERAWRSRSAGRP